MATKSYADSLFESKLMIDGLKNNKETLPAGIDETFINNIERIKDEVQKLNSEQEKLKADLKSKTKVLEESHKLLQQQYAEAKKRIKLDIPQTQWREYGIEDKK
ncbi:MAG: membrane-binding protein [Capnocytophaga sp.]|nr:membrane-binding protein [Capnocytophaga sp.]